MVHRFHCTFLDGRYCFSMLYHLELCQRYFFFEIQEYVKLDELMFEHYCVGGDDS